MDHDYLYKLKASHPTLRLLNADNAPLIISFLFRVFVKPNQRSLRYSELVSRLDDFLFQLRDIYGEEHYPKSAKQYLEDWSNPKTAFVRKYYADLGDEPEFDLTPATEKAIDWLRSLEEKQFVGTESRLLTVFQLLREIVHKTEQDPAVRIAELERQKQDIDTEIDKIQAGIIEPFDPTQIKERFFQVDETARKLLGDFRQVEYNFRALDRQTRERIATSDKTKGQLLDDIFQENDVIWDSDQGKSFRAFWEFLMSPRRQDELERLLVSVFDLDEIRSLASEPFLEHIKVYLLEAGENVYKTNNLLVEQLRKYLDDQTYLENKRITELIKSIEKRAIEIKNTPPRERNFAELSELKPAIDPVMSRGLFMPPTSPTITATPLDDVDVAIELDALYEQTFIDETELSANIRQALQNQSQISLSQLARRYPIRKGLAEIVGYLNLASRDDKAYVADDETDMLYITLSNGQSKQVELPKVIFVR